MSGRHVVVIGAGIGGLTAAYQLRQSDPTLTVTVCEAGDRVGGKIRTTAFHGRAVDEGADAFLARVPWARELCDELGLRSELTSPANGSAYIWSYGALRRVPATNLLGVPLDADELRASGLVHESALAHFAADLERTADPRPADDESIGSLIRRRLGDEIAQRLVDPLIGGIYAGDIDQLSLRATAPQFAEAADRSPSLVTALRRTRLDALAAAPDRPVFYAVTRGTAALCEALATRLAPGVRLQTPVRAVTAHGDRYDVVLDGETLTADALVLATPTYVTAPLLAAIAPGAAAQSGAIDYASVALATLAIPRSSIDHPLDASGFLVPKCEDRFITACSWASTKWAHLADDNVAILRVSAGHVNDATPLTFDDDALVERMMRDLRDMMGRLGQPVEVRVTRWKDSFPQYRPGHASRVAELHHTLGTEAPRVVLTGAAYGGIGIPATIRHARDSALSLLTGI